MLPVSIRRATVRADAWATALAELDLEVPAGECLVIMGANGSGKSMLLRAVAGFVPLADGRILVSGNPPAKANPGQMAYVTQDPDAGLVGLTVEDQLRWGLAPGTEAEDRVRRALEQFHLDHLSRRAVERLSGGEKQRVAMAAWAAAGAGLWLLDEPSSWLDAAGAGLMREAIQGLHQQGATILWASHDWEDALLADRILVLKGGRAMAIGSPQVILTHPRLPMWDVETPPATLLSQTLRRDGLAGPLTANPDELGQWLLR